MIRNLKLIGICGNKRNGKDTVADYLTEKYEFYKYELASPIKDVCRVIFDFSEEQLYGNEKEIVDERWGTTPRKLLQIIGTELFQEDIHKYMKEGEFNIGRKIWVLKFKHWLEDINKENIFDFDLNVVVSDVRMLHEVDVIRELGGTIWKVSNNRIPLEDNHLSESSLNGFTCDVLIENNGTLEELYEKVEKILNN